jgi:hypothetical protein
MHHCETTWKSELDLRLFQNLDFSICHPVGDERYILVVEKKFLVWSF